VVPSFSLFARGDLAVTRETGRQAVGPFRLVAFVSPTTGVARRAPAPGGAPRWSGLFLQQSCVARLDAAGLSVRFEPLCGLKSDIAVGPSWARAQSRCAPARCAGARAERLELAEMTATAGSGYSAWSNTSRSSAGQHLYTARHIDPTHNEMTKLP
jgi:hypothetical protein